jgi:hypothetical protein
MLNLSFEPCFVIYMDSTGLLGWSSVGICYGLGLYEHEKRFLVHHMR